MDKCRSPLQNDHFNRAKQLVMLDTNFIQFYFDKNVAKSFLKMWGKWRYHGMGEAGRRCQEMAPKPFYARVDIHISPHGCTHTQRKLKWKSQTQHQILLSKHRFELCVGVCRLIVEERGQVPDNWIQLCQTEYLIPFGRRLRGRSCGNYTILTLRELFLIIFSHLQLLLIEPYLRVERILNPRVCHLCKKRMDDWGAGRRE